MITRQVSPASAVPGLGEGDAQTPASMKEGEEAQAYVIFSDHHKVANIAEDFFLCACLDLAAVGSWAKFPPA